MTKHSPQAEPTCRPIVIFDSGVGGLSIYACIRKLLPNQQVIYCSDNSAFPYGTKTDLEVEERTSLCLNHLDHIFQPALIVIACNTASTLALPRVREELETPIVGVVPAIKTAANQTKNGVIGLLATPATIMRPYTDQLIDEFASHCEVIRVGSSELVEQAERKLRGLPLNMDILEKQMQSFFWNSDLSPDYIILGCTHFPLIQAPLMTATKRPVHFVDSGKAIACRVKTLLEQKNQISSKKTRENIAIFTAQEENIKQLYPYLSVHEFNKIGIINFNKKQIENLK